MNKKNRKSKILMIEDDIFLRKIYRDQLTQAGFEFIEATNGVEGLHKVITDNPDLILLDLMLPLKNGFDVLEELRTNPKTKNIPVIVLSNLSQRSDIQEALNLGAQDYLIKTDIRISEVVNKVNEWLLKR